MTITIESISNEQRRREVIERAKRVQRRRRLMRIQRLVEGAIAGVDLDKGMCTWRIATVTMTVVIYLDAQGFVETVNYSGPSRTNMAGAMAEAKERLAAVGAYESEHELVATYFFDSPTGATHCGVRAATVITRVRRLMHGITFSGFEFVPDGVLADSAPA